jgi:hypothetical protein
MKLSITAVAFLGWLLALTSCQTTSPTGAKVKATVTIQDRSLSEIRLATIEVFEENAYTVHSAHDRHLIFDKQGSALRSLAYGAWMDPTVWIRATVDIVSLGAHGNVLDCTVSYIQNRGDSILEEEQTSTGMKRGPFQKMLEAIKARLEESPAGLNSTNAAPKPPTGAPRP